LDKSDYTTRGFLGRKRRCSEKIEKQSPTTRPLLISGEIDSGRNWKKGLGKMETAPPNNRGIPILKYSLRSNSFFLERITFIPATNCELRETKRTAAITDGGMTVKRAQSFGTKAQRTVRPPLIVRT
jgi:hypothetical protein